MKPTENNYTGLEIAIIGMSGRFPGANDLEKFWQNLRDGVESVTLLNDEQLQKNGVEPTLLNHPNYIKAEATIENMEWFDAEFFGFSPREAEILDPQQRLFLESAWSALEDAGYNADKYSGAIAVYAGAAMNGYLFNLASNPTIQNSVSHYQLFLGNDKDFLTTRVSYKLNLRGPSVDIQTACSTSLVAVHIACQSLLSGECDIALAGGVSLSKPTGYLYQEGGIYSPDGHCRAFDADAKGTISGSGLGVVVLKRLQDALDDRDYIHAVIKGSAINNDGALKVSYTAPRIDTQAAVIRTAQAVAEINPETISYIETHGTGTALGDPIEIAALSQAFGSVTKKTGYCAISSVKTNIGHLDAAAGIASLIKTVLALKHKQIPPSLHFQQPNPQIDFNKTPFYVNSHLTDWNTDSQTDNQTNNTPRRAGVSSFGIGGTNAHVILEEAPTPTPSSSSRSWQLLLLSAKNEAALTASTDNLTRHLQENELNLADVAYTLQVGRQHFQHRKFFLCENTQEIISDATDKLQVLTQIVSTESSEIVFMFPGQGSQYVNMGKELYETETVFQEQVDYCCELLQPHLKLDLRTLIYPITPTSLSPSSSISPPPLPPSSSLSQTTYTQPALFVIEYALAKLWISWGIQPQAMIGHSIGEYVAATLAGVFSLEDALKLVALRGKLMQECPPGAMLSVWSSLENLQPLLSDNLVIAAHNAPESFVISGTEAEITELELLLSQQNILYRRLQTSHAFHSPLMDEIITPFTDIFSNIQLKSPQIPFISNVTGDWITDLEATNPNYWSTHLRQPVQFSLGVTELLKQSNRILLEVGAGHTLSTLVISNYKQQTHTHTVLSSLRHPQDTQSDVQFILKTLGQLWLAGVEIDWSGFYAAEQRQRVPLPTYPFQRQRYWVDLQENLGDEINSQSQVSQIKSQTQNQKPFDWFYIPSWERSLHRKTVDLSKEKHCWLVLADNYGVGKDIIQTLQSAGHDVIVVTVGNKYEQTAYRTFTVNPQEQQDFVDLLEDLQLRELLPSQIIYLWSLIGDDKDVETVNLRTLQGLTQAITCVGEGSVRVQITIVTNNGQLVLGNEEINPLQASFLGMSKVISQEIPHVNCRCVDIVLPKETNTHKQITQQLITGCLTPTMETVVAYRGNHRWQQIFKSVQIDTPTLSQLPLQAGGTYLIVGDLKTGLGSVFSEFLPKTLTTRLILIGEEIPAILKQSLDDAGVENICINIDITDKKQFRSAILEAEDKFGVINGVFYSTPMSNEYSMALLPQLTTAHWDYNYRTKVEGLFVLAEIFCDKTLDFCLLQSSLSSILGGLGLTAYAAANAVIDAFAVQQNQVSNFPWISINWDACRSEDEISEDEAKINSSFIANLSVSALTPQEVWEATSRIMALGVPESVIVSKSNLHERLEQWVTPKQLSNTEFNSLNNTSHARPNLGNEYVAPRNETEEAIGEIWQELLGITPIGINDSFFDLGGHSLMAIQAISRLRDRFGVELSMRNLLYEAPTIAGIAAFIQTQQPQPEDLEEMTALLNEIQSLSPEEIAQQLG